MRVSAAVLAGCAVFAGALSLASVLPDTLVSTLFCRVPTGLAALFFNADIQGSSLVLGSGRVIAVTRDCGGTDFFALVCAVLTWHALRQKGAAMLRLLPLGWCGAWAFTVLVNGMRVIVTVWTRVLVEHMLPERYYGAVHLVSGVLVFFPALLLLWWLCVRHDLSGKG